MNISEKGFCCCFHIFNLVFFVRILLNRQLQSSPISEQRPEENERIQTDLENRIKFVSFFFFIKSLSNFSSQTFI